MTPTWAGLTAEQRRHYVEAYLRRAYPKLGPVGLKALRQPRPAQDKSK